MDLNITIINFECIKFSIVCCNTQVANFYIYIKKSLHFSRLL